MQHLQERPNGARSLLYSTGCERKKAGRSWPCLLMVEPSLPFEPSPDRCKTREARAEEQESTGDGNRGHVAEPHLVRPTAIRENPVLVRKILAGDTGGSLIQ